MAVAQAELGDYLTEIRNTVCSRCVERPRGGPPCAPLGKNCGVEMHLPQLISSVRQVHSNLLEPYLEHNRNTICEQCSFLHSAICPCPMDYLSCLVVEAVEAVDERRAAESTQTAAEERQPGGLQEMTQAYRDGSGTWTGCDWPTQFGKTGLDLQGCQAADARIMADENRGTVAGEDWAAAATWLMQVEKHAHQAESRAAAAIAAAAAGQWREALQFAEQAWALEFGTGRAIWHSFPLAWQKLRQAAEGAYLAHKE